MKKSLKTARRVRSQMAPLGALPVAAPVPTLPLLLAARNYSSDDSDELNLLSQRLKFEESKRAGFRAYETFDTKLRSSHVRAFAYFYFAQQ